MHGSGVPTTERFRFSTGTEREKICYMDGKKMFQRSVYRMCIGIILFLMLVSPNITYCQTPITIQPPEGDLWHYPFNVSPGTRTAIPLFWNDGAVFAQFNMRDGNGIFLWDTSGQITPGQNPQDYDVLACTVTIWNTDGATWQLSGNNNSGLPNRIEMFGVGFDTINSATWTETTPYVGGTVSGPIPPAPRDPYPIDLDTGSHAEDLITAVPWTEGVPQGYTPGSQTTPFEITFDLNVSDATILAYIRQSLADGRLHWFLCSTLDPPASGGMPSITPLLVSKEGLPVNPGAEAAKLEITLDDQPSSVALWSLY